MARDRWWKIATVDYMAKKIELHSFKLKGRYI